MKRKKAFVSYRPEDKDHVQSIMGHVRTMGFDSHGLLYWYPIDEGESEHDTLNEIKDREYFILMLTPRALERCINPNDTMRREIELALEHKRYIIPVLFKDFQFADTEPYLVGVLKILPAYNAVRVYDDNDNHEVSFRIFKRIWEDIADLVLSPIPRALTDHDYFERAEYYRTHDDHEHAIADYSEIIHRNPQHVLAFYNRGLSYKEESQFKSARDDFTEVIRLDPQNALAFYNRALSYGWNERDADLLIADFTQAIRIDPHFAEAYVARAVSYQDHKQDYEQTIRDLNEAIRIRPLEGRFYERRGLGFYRQEDFDHAIADFNEALRLGVSQPMSTYHIRAYSYYKAQDYERAIADFSELIRYRHEDFNAYRKRGDCYYAQGKYELAIADYQEIIEILAGDDQAEHSIEKARKALEQKKK